MVAPTSSKADSKCQVAHPLERQGQAERLAAPGSCREKRAKISTGRPPPLPSARAWHRGPEDCLAAVKGSDWPRTRRPAAQHAGFETLFRQEGHHEVGPSETLWRNVGSPVPLRQCLAPRGLCTAGGPVVHGSLPPQGTSTATARCRHVKRNDDTRVRHAAQLAFRIEPGCFSECRAAWIWTHAARTSADTQAMSCLSGLPCLSSRSTEERGISKRSIQPAPHPKRPRAKKAHRCSVLRGAGNAGRPSGVRALRAHLLVLREAQTEQLGPNSARSDHKCPGIGTTWTDIDQICHEVGNNTRPGA